MKLLSHYKVYKLPAISLLLGAAACFAMEDTEETVSQVSIAANLTENQGGNEGAESFGGLIHTGKELFRKEFVANPKKSSSESQDDPAVFNNKDSADYFYSELKRLCTKHVERKGYKFIKFDVLGKNRSMKAKTSYDGQGIKILPLNIPVVRQTSIGQPEIVSSPDFLPSRDLQDRWTPPYSYWEHNPNPTDEVREFKKNSDETSNKGNTSDHEKTIEVTAGMKAGPGVGPVSADVHGDVKRSVTDTKHQEQSVAIKKAYEESGQFLCPANSSINIVNAMYKQTYIKQSLNVKVISGSIPVQVKKGGKESVEIYGISELFNNKDDPGIFSSYVEITDNGSGIMGVQLAQEAGNESVIGYVESKNIIIYPYFGKELIEAGVTEDAYVSTKGLNASNAPVTS